MTTTGTLPDTAPITAVIDAYAERLRADDVDGIVDLYTDDAIVLAHDFPTATGRDAIRGIYAQFLDTVAMEARFAVDDVAVWGDSAAVCSHSTDVLTVRAAGERGTAAFRELFVLRHGDQGWKIVRYMFQPITA